MGNFFSELGAQIKQLWQGLVAWQRAVLISTLVLVPLGLVWLVISLRPDYVVLHSNLSEADMILIEQQLTEAGIRYRSSTAEKSIAVKPSDEGRARVLLVEEGLPHLKMEGYNIFDRQRLGATEFEQRLNFKRALQQELRRRLETLDSVLRAEVDLVIPTPTVFTEREKAPTASVTITPRGPRLSQAQVDGIAMIVANAVEGLTPENVVISDNNGIVLSRRRDALAQMTEEQRALRLEAERSREEKIIEVLNRAYGAKVDGKAITSVGTARVTAEYDHDSIETEKTQYDPETIVAKEQIVSESSEGVPMPSVGVPGVTSNILGAGAVQGTGTYTREESTTEYQAGITREVRRRAPKLTKLTTAVVVNSQVLSAAPGTPEYISEQNQIKNLIYAAVGYVPGAPDNIIQEPQVEFISFAPLQEMPTPTAPPVVWWKNPLVVLSAILGLITLALLALLLKPRFGREVGEEEGAEALPASDIEELRALLDQQRSSLDEEERERRRRRRQALIDLADANPEEIERVMRHWGEASSD